jgi:glycosyltransferase involved in cell wall biosynthesis
MKPGITAHIMVKNEEYFIRSAVEAILPLCTEVIVFDTGSTDNTPAIVQGIPSDKIRFFEKGDRSARELIDLRNEMVRLTTTEWFFVVDGDEIYFFKNPKKLLDELGRVPQSVSRLEVTIRDFVRDAHLVARDRTMGRLWRTSNIRFVGIYPFERPALKKNLSAPLDSFSSDRFKKDIISYHMCFFPRSSKDLEVRAGRHWRPLPFIIKPFFGPYPPQFKAKTGWPHALAGFVMYNLVGAWQRFFSSPGPGRKAQKSGANN